MIRYTRDVLRTLASPCRSQTRLISRRMDDGLSPGESAGVRIHLCICGSCHAFARQLERLRVFARLEAVARPLPQAMPAAVRERLIAAAAHNGPDLPRSL